RDGPQRYQTEPTDQVRLPPPSHAPARLTQRATDCAHEQKPPAPRRENPMRALLVEPVRVDDRRRAWQQRLSDVVIDDDDLKPGCRCIGERQMCIRPAIYG